MPNRRDDPQQEMVLFTLTYDFISWLIPRTMGFPRSQRFVVTKRLQDAALDFYEGILEANNAWGKARLEKQDRADASLDKVRIYLRLCHRWSWLSQGQYQHAAGMVSQIGRLLGGWKKQTRQSAASR